VLAAAIGGLGASCGRPGVAGARASSSPSAASAVAPGADASADAASGGAGASPASLEPRYLKGQLHAHSSNSRDSATPPAEVAAWYESRGFDFLVFTDHNRVTHYEHPGRLLTLPGAELTQNLPRCSPPPERGLRCLLHANALFASASATEDKLVFPARTELFPRRLDVYQAALDMAASLGAISQLNHPNFHFAADAGLLIELSRRGVVLFEVANQAVDSSNGGDDRHPSTEAIWDTVLTSGATVYGTATDDAHHYDDAERVRAMHKTPHTGDKGFVMVWARLEASAIREALVRGEFYASTGVVLERASLAGGALEVAVDRATEGEAEIAFVGREGKRLATSRGRAASFPVPAEPGAYVRAVVSDARGRRAWVQPVRAK
jgi:hypothetical protein